MHFGGFLLKRFLLKNGKKVNFGGPEKPRLFGPKMVPKRVPKKITSKTEIFSFFMIFYENIIFYRSEWASRADSTVIYNVFTRPEGQENHAQCGQNLRKTMIFVIFLCCLRNASNRFWAFQGTKMGSEKWFRSTENRKAKNDSKRGALETRLTTAKRPKKKPDRTRTGSAVLSAY